MIQYENVHLLTLKTSLSQSVRNITIIIMT